MNFLAHCVLAARAKPLPGGELIAGGILGDLWKGALPDSWPRGLRDGVRLHRRIDAVSNRHPAIKASCARFPAPLRRLAPVLVDIHADLALADSWPAWQVADLPDFTRDCYRALTHLRKDAVLLSDDAHRFLHHLEARNLLARYATWDGVALCIDGVARRLRMREGDFTGEALAACERLSGLLCQDFAEYFPDLLAEAQAFVLSELNDEVGEQQILDVR